MAKTWKGTKKNKNSVAKTWKGTKKTKKTKDLEVLEALSPEDL